MLSTVIQADRYGGHKSVSNQWKHIEKNCSYHKGLAYAQ